MMHSKKQKRHKRHKRNGVSAVLASPPILLEYDSDVVDVCTDGAGDHSSAADVDNPAQHLHSRTASAKPSTSTSASETTTKPIVMMTSDNHHHQSPLSAALNKSQKRKKNRNKDSGTSSDEERWLDAIESGKLEQVEQVELKKIKDPKLMTARQRAMYERGNNGDNKEPSATPSAEILMALPSGYKEKVMTAEAIQKAAIKSQKRKQLADEKREKEKKRTMDRLLKKQDSRAANKSNRARPARSVEPVVSYRSTQHGMTITFPPHYDLALFGASPSNVAAAATSPSATSAVVAEASPTGKDCSMCGAAKRYNCSRTNIPLCSFRCYKLNVDALKAIMC